VGFFVFLPKKGLFCVEMYGYSVENMFLKSVKKGSFLGQKRPKKAIFGCFFRFFSCFLHFFVEKLMPIIRKMLKKRVFSHFFRGGFEKVPAIVKHRYTNRAESRVKIPIFGKNYFCKFLWNSEKTLFFKKV